MKFLVLVLSLVLSLVSIADTEETSSLHWLGTWAAAPQPASRLMQVQNMTIRQIVHVSVGGSRLRLHFSNKYGANPWKVTAARVGISGGQDMIVPGSNLSLTVQGKTSFVVAPGVELISDPLSMVVPSFSNLAISLYFSDPVEMATFHSVARQMNYWIAGNQVDIANLNSPLGQTSWFGITGVDVLAPRQTCALVAMGDSITDGVGSSLDSNHRWPDYFAQTISAGNNPSYSVLNEGVGFNRILDIQTDEDQPSVAGLTRFYDDVIRRPGVCAVIMMEGINDIGLTPPDQPAAEIVARLQDAYLKLVKQARAAGIKFFISTLTPMQGSGYASPQHLLARRLLNNWILKSKEFDGVFDFSGRLADPQNPEALRADVDGGDHLHPNDFGYQEIARAIQFSAQGTE